MSNQPSTPSQLAPAKHPKKLSGEFIKALNLKHLKPRTIDAYVNAMSDFVRFHNGFDPLTATVNDIRAYLFYLKEDRQYAPRSYNPYFYGLKAFYEIFLPDVPLMDSFRRQKPKACNITIISRFEFDDMIRFTKNLKHQAMFEVLYGSGIRLGECVHLQIKDIDRKQMLLRVMGKGGKKRFTILPQRTINTIIAYYKSETRKPSKYLFEGHGGKVMAPNSIEHAVRIAIERAGIKKKLHPTFFAIVLPLIFLKPMEDLMYCKNF